MMDVDSAAVPERDQQDGQNQNPGQSQSQSQSQSASGSVPSQSLHGERDEQLPSHQQQQQQPHSAAAVGPRPAPTYSVVNAILEKKEDGPGPRCGHTLTAVAAVGEEGSPGYVGPRLILFGGATALEGNSAISGPPSSGASTGIRLVGATADVHCYYNAFEQMVKTFATWRTAIASCCTCCNCCGYDGRYSGWDRSNWLVCGGSTCS